MQQIAWNFRPELPATVYRTVARREFILRRVQTNHSLFRPDFLEWLEANFPVWERFEREANRVYDNGRTHYSARTIIEWMRHETDAREVGGDWKINNSQVPMLARLFALMWPERKDLFEFRG